MDAPPLRPLVIAPSVLSADWSRIGEVVEGLEAAGADRIHWDVMDGHFVPNLSVGADVIAACRDRVRIPFEVHLMVDEPGPTLERYTEAGCEMLIVHAEACRHLHRTLGRAGELGARAGVALNPATPPVAATHVLDLVGQVLVMTVNPGFGGQPYLTSMEAKVAALASELAARELDVDVEVDGGVAEATAAGAVRAGANVLVSGSALVRHPCGLATAVSTLRQVAEAARRPAGGGF